MKNLLLSFAFTLSLAAPFSSCHAYSGYISEALIGTAYSIYLPFDLSANLTTHGDPLYDMRSCKQEIGRMIRNDVQEYVATGIASEALSATFKALSEKQLGLNEEELIDVILKEFNE